MWAVAATVLSGVGAMYAWQVDSATAGGRGPEWLSVWTYSSGVGCGPNGCIPFEVRTNRITGARQYRTVDGSWAAE